MSADHPAKFIEAEDIAKIRKSGLKAIAGVYVEDLLQAIEGSRELAETMMRDVAELRKASESFELAFQNKALGMCVDRLTIERDEARAEVQRLTEIVDTRKAARESLAEVLKLQEIGETMGLRVGDEIPSKILPWMLAKNEEVQRLTEQNVSMEAEIRILTDEARRSDAGRVEVPERAAWLTIEEIAAVIEAGAADYKMDLLRSQALHIARLIACASMDKGSRLSPSPQPSADVVVVPSRDALISALDDLLARRENMKATVSTCMDLAEAEGLSRDSLALAYLRNVLMAQPKRETIQTVNALRSSTNHDAQDAGEGR